MHKGAALSAESLTMLQDKLTKRLNKAQSVQHAPDDGELQCGAHLDMFRGAGFWRYGGAVLQRPADQHLRSPTHLTTSFQHANPWRAFSGDAQRVVVPRVCVSWCLEGPTGLPTAEHRGGQTCAGRLPMLRAMLVTSGLRSSAGTSLCCSMYAVAGHDDAITCTPCKGVLSASGI